MEKQHFVKPSKAQEDYWNSIYTNTITIVTGPAGTGKSFLALAAGIQLLLEKNNGIERLVIIRPYMPSNTGEKIGYLPGDVKEKVGPYVEGIKDNLRAMNYTEEFIFKMLDKIEFTTLSMCRGRSFNKSFVIVEECQNTPLSGDAIKMLLTRIGKDSKMVLGGDLDQIDIPEDESALFEAINALQRVPGIGVIELTEDAIQRSGMVRKVLVAFREYRKNH